MAGVHQALLAIQASLKAPKNQYNAFGKYNYRSCEDILEAVKPLAREQGCTVRLSDKVILVGDRYFLEATATLTGDDGGQAVCTASAEIPREKKGMDASQITGTASSYARKYALNGLFAIDDTKDADTQDNHGQNRPANNKAQDRAQEKSGYKCADCGREFKNTADREGRLWTPQMQYDAAVKVSPDGKARCRNCREKLQSEDRPF